ncbi:MAG: hypothetical protein ABIU87_11800 [Ornithinibacter sp.]
MQIAATMLVATSELLAEIAELFEVGVRMFDFVAHEKDPVSC